MEKSYSLEHWFANSSFLSLLDKWVIEYNKEKEIPYFQRNILNKHLRKLTEGYASFGENTGIFKAVKEGKYSISNGMSHSLNNNQN